MILERLFSDVSPEVVAGILDRRPRWPRALRGRRRACCSTPRGTDLHALMKAADVARRRGRGDDVSFVVCRNINFTNVCYVGCSFCGFSRHKRGRRRRLRPSDGDAPREGPRRRRARGDRGVHPGRHPPEQGPHPLPRDPGRDQGRSSRISTSTPTPPRRSTSGTARAAWSSPTTCAGSSTRASARCPAPRPRSSTTRSASILSPNKLRPTAGSRSSTAAHSIGLPTTATIMYGHIETREHVARHLTLIREIQKRDRRLHRVRAPRLHPREERAVQPHGRAPGRLRCPRTCG